MNYQTLLRSCAITTTTTTSATIKALRETRAGATVTHDGYPKELARRIASHGFDGLAVAEVMGVALDGGSAEAIDVSRRLLDVHGGSLRKLAQEGEAHLKASVPHGMTPTRARRLAAALELAKRLACENADEGVPIRAPRDVFHAFARLIDLPHEEFHVAILDAQHRLVRDVLVTRGILNSSLVHPREVFREAIADRAAAIVLVHNHPSGDPTPSVDDRAVTEQLVAAGRLLDIPVHDHVIVGRGRFVSFAEAGLL